MKSREKELQDRILNGESTQGFEDTEIRAYRQVFSSLSMEKEMTLSPGFADKVAGIVEAKQQSAHSHDMLWLVLSITGLTGFSIFTILYTDVRIDLGFLSSVSRYWIFMVACPVLYFLIQWIDLKLIHSRLE